MFNWKQKKHVGYCLKVQESRSICSLLVYPQLVYCMTIWRGAHKTSLHSNVLAIRWTVRQTTGVPRLTHTQPISKNGIDLHWISYTTRKEDKPRCFQEVNTLPENRSLNMQTMDCNYATRATGTVRVPTVEYLSHRDPSALYLYFVLNLHAERTCVALLNSLGSASSTLDAPGDNTYANKVWFMANHIFVIYLK